MPLLEEGQVIRDTYEVERFLGQGAFAEVYRVKHRFLGRQAMKVFKRVGMSLDEIQEMLGEAILLSRIGHPNIVRVSEARAKAASAEAESAEELVEAVENSPLLKEVGETLAAAKGDADAAAKCEKRLLELKLKLDEATNALQWPSLIAEAKDWLEHIDQVVERHGTQQQKQKAAEIATQIDDIIRDRQTDRLRKRIDQATRLYYDIVTSQAGWWVYQFQQMEKQEQEMIDQARAARLLDQGRECLAKSNTTGLQNVVRQLWDLLPDELVKAAKRGYQSGLVR